jgi:hypothetical protein
MRIKSVKVYQAVSFDKKLHTFFLAESSGNNKPIITIEFMPEILCIKFSNDNDTVLVPLTNVASIQLHSKNTEEHDAWVKEQKNAKVGVKSHEAKK